MNVPVRPSEVHPMEVESYRVLAGRLDLSAWPTGPRTVVERVIHASADLDYAETMVVGEVAVAAGVEALRAGAPVVADVEMTARGITVARARCWLAEVTDAETGSGPTRSAAAMRRAAERHPDGAVFVVGCAPSALLELVRLARTGAVRPALVVGMPVGFVGAAESKERLRHSGLPAISNRGEKGGSAVAAAACNALGRLARE